MVLIQSRLEIPRRRLEGEPLERGVPDHDQHCDRAFGDEARDHRLPELRDDSEQGGPEQFVGMSDHQCEPPEGRQPIDMELEWTCPECGQVWDGMKAWLVRQALGLTWSRLPDTP